MVVQSLWEQSVDINMAEDKQQKFVNLLKNYSVLFSKSQLPEVKSKKSIALKELADKCEKELGLIIKTPNLTKKIHNLKRDVKQKSDITRTGEYIFQFVTMKNKNLTHVIIFLLTGNRKIVLKPFEKDVLNLMGADENPSVSRLKNGLSAGFGTMTENVEKPDDTETQSLCSGISEGIILFFFILYYSNICFLKLSAAKLLLQLLPPDVQQNGVERYVWTPLILKMRKLVDLVQLSCNV